MSRLSRLVALVFSAGLLLSSAANAQPRSGGLDYSRNIEQEIVRMTNSVRADFGLQPLAAVEPLADVARSHSKEMLQFSYFEHESPTPGLTHPWDRVFGSGIHTNRVAENIFSAEGYRMNQVAEECVRDWMKRPGHRANILSPKNTCVGVGVAIHNGEVMVTQEFTGPMELGGTGGVPLSDSPSY